MVFNPTGAAYLESPYEAFQQQREREPIVWSERNRKWFVFRHHDCVQLLQHPALSNQTYSRKIERLPALARWVFRGIERSMLASMLFQDAPVHERLRGSVARYLGAIATKELKATIEEQVQSLLEAMPRQGVVDVTTALSVPLPINVIGLLLDVPRRDLKWMRAKSITISQPFLQARPGVLGFLRADRAIRSLLAYFDRLIADQKTRPLAGLPKELIESQHLSHDELLTMYLLLVIAGHETTANMLSNALLTLLRHPEALQRLRDAPARLPDAVDEFLRYETSVIGVGRVAKHDFEYEGVAFKKDQHVTLFLGSANRDEACTKAAGHFDLDRPSARSLAFGYGKHACLGANLVRLELRTALAGFLQRYRHIALHRPPRWQSSAVHRGPRQLLLRVS